MLSDEDRRTLLALARQTVSAAAHGRRPPDLTNPSGALRQKGAAFVTLRNGPDLRGCIGHVEAVKALWLSVREMAEAAATRDSRFNPVRPDELDGLRLEISVLSPLRPLRAEEIVVGTHGLYVRRGPDAGLLLPQVATEWGWDRSEFLRRVLEKAGIPSDDGAEIFGFTADRIH